MKTRKGIRVSFGHQHAFTMTELMVVMAVFLMVLGAVISSHVFGLKLLKVANSQAQANDSGHFSLNMLVSDIQSAKTLRVGQGNLSSFTDIALGSPQQGGAIELNTSTNTNYFIRYYLDSAAKSLKRMTNGSGRATTIATLLTNQVLFAAENFSGQVLTNSQNNSIVHVTLQFFGLENPAVSIGPGGTFSSYRVETRVVRRASD